MAVSKKHQPVGQRYQIGIVFIISSCHSSGKGNSRTRYGTIGCNATPNKGAINYYYMVRWEGSNSGSPQTYSAQLKSLPFPDSCFDNIVEN